MDPQATWNLLIDEWTQCNWIDVHELAEALQNWMTNGGFPPDTSGGKYVGGEWNRIVALAVCKFTLRTADAALDSPNGIPSEVPFAMSCQDCGDEGPNSYDAAISEGWKLVRYTPAGLSENFLGRCPVCQKSET